MENQTTSETNQRECKECGSTMYAKDKKKKYCGSVKDQWGCAYLMHLISLRNRRQKTKREPICIKCKQNLATHPKCLNCQILTHDTPEATVRPGKWNKAACEECELTLASVR